LVRIFVRVILIEGSARGIGQGICLNFAKVGATIAAFDFRDTSETISLVKEASGAEAKGWQLDATDEKAVKAAIDEVEKELGPIKVLVNCAGIVGSRPVLMEHYDNFRRTMDVNCGAVSPYKILLITDHDLDSQHPTTHEGSS
jgi:NAD(P)-dependent dehydrogenase (short-subunit alcohol dehydrogenase family)